LKFHNIGKLPFTAIRSLLIVSVETAINYNKAPSAINLRKIRICDPAYLDWFVPACSLLLVKAIVNLALRMQWLQIQTVCFLRRSRPNFSFLLATYKATCAVDAKREPSDH
jgi:hypothetical protein